jgi:hypothetical protein
MTTDTTTNYDYRDGDLVRIKDSDSVFTVTSVDNYGEFVNIINEEGEADSRHYFDLELVSSVDDIKVHKDNVPQPNPVPVVRTEAEVLEVVSNYFMQAIQLWYANDTGENLELSIKTEVSAHNKEFTLTYAAQLGYGRLVKSRSIHKSLEIAMNRHSEDKAHQPLEIAYRSGGNDETS